MSRGSKLTILGLYNYNQDIFEGLTVPDGLDKEAIINAIVMDCSAFELLYPSYTFMKMAIKNWSDMEQKIWTKLYNTENFDYNPIWNVDGTVEEIQDGTGIGSTKGYNSSSWLESEKTDTDNKITTKRTGNIGVTTTQQMIREEREVVQFNTAKYIVDSFKKRFCLLIY